MLKVNNFSFKLAQNDYIIAISEAIILKNILTEKYIPEISQI